MSSTSRSSGANAGPGEDGITGTAPEHVTVSALESHLGYWLRLVSNHVSHTFATEIARHGVTVAEWVVLRMLFDDDGIKPSELATRLGLTRGAISKLIDRLVAKSLVSVRSDARDGRAQRLTLRVRGRRLVPILAALADANDARAFAHLDPGERTMLMAAARRIVACMGIRGTPLD